jgi:hypothetical protein
MDPQVQAIYNKLSEMRQLKIDIAQINNSRKTAKSKMEEINGLVVPFMISKKLTHISAELDGPSTGPHYVLSKNVSPGSWNETLQQEYWKQFIDYMKEHPELFTVENCMKTQRDFLKAYDKRSIVLNEITQLRVQSGVDKLLKWVNTGVDE